MWFHIARVQQSNSAWKMWGVPLWILQTFEYDSAVPHFFPKATENHDTRGEDVHEQAASTWRMRACTVTPSLGNEFANVNTLANWLFKTLIVNLWTHYLLFACAWWVFHSFLTPSHMCDVRHRHMCHTSTHVWHGHWMFLCVIPDVMSEDGMSRITNTCNPCVWLTQK